MYDFDLDRAVERLARRQHGAFNRDQLRALGGDRRQATRRVTSGSWVALTPSVWVLSAYPPSWRRQCMAATLSVPGAVTCGPPAGHLLRLEASNAVRPEIAVPYSSNTRCPIAKVHRTSGVPTTYVDRIPVTTIAQTLFDLLGRRSLDRIERAMDGALLEGRVTIDELEERVAALSGTRKAQVATFTALVRDRREGPSVAESVLELALWRIVTARHDLPPFAPQATLPWRSEAPGRVDAYCEARGLIVEVDGRRWHGRVADFDRDRWRDSQATAHGLRTLRFTHVHLVERPEEVGDVIAAACQWRVAAA